eukprot:15335588-Ditylum_brightwellii.AAC.1
MTEIPFASKKPGTITRIEPEIMNAMQICFNLNLEDKISAPQATMTNFSLIPQPFTSGLSSTSASSDCTYSA